jgi:RimJ/RimL family protein N-acetyltransferase
MDLLATLDAHWARHLGCLPPQLRDGGKHVVGRPEKVAGLPPPPFRRGPAAIFTTGSGWVLSVPAGLVEKGAVLCDGKDFGDVVDAGDCLGQEWFDGGAHENTQMKRSDVTAGYQVMNRLALGMRLRGWSHYILSYAEASSHVSVRDPNVQKITADIPHRWEQWQSWPGPMCGPSISRHFPISAAFGYVLRNELVSAAQLEAYPDELAWEYGVDTLPAYRNRGFATRVVRCITSYIVEQGHVPLHYTDHYNRPSRRLPEKSGYFRYGEGLFSAL